MTNHHAASDRFRARATVSKVGLDTAEHSGRFPVGISSTRQLMELNNGLAYHVVSRGSAR